MKRSIITKTALTFVGCFVMTSSMTFGNTAAATQMCQLISANSPAAHPFGSIPRVVNDKNFKNRRPKIAYTVREDGAVTNVRVLKGTGSPRIDAGLVKSVQAWKYKPQPGCVVDTSMVVTIDVK